jgi:hypothetical protein
VIGALLPQAAQKEIGNYFMPEHHSHKGKWQRRWPRLPKQQQKIQGHNAKDCDKPKVEIPNHKIPIKPCFCGSYS